MVNGTPCAKTEQKSYRLAVVEVREWDIHALRVWWFDAWVPWLYIKVSFGQILKPKLLPMAITSV